MHKMVRPPPKAQSEESFTISEWPRNTRGQTNRVSLRTYRGHALFDVRIWWTGDDGIAQHPGKGFSCRLKDLPRLVEATAEALKKAKALGFLNSEGSE
jgi:Transcriptional Coactivator p15 (PC4)